MNTDVISLCGLDCAECEHYQNTCDACYAVNCITFWAQEIMPNKVCPLFQCAFNERGYESCGDCAELPCSLFLQMKDPSSTDEEHQKMLEIRVQRLKS